MYLAKINKYHAKTKGTDIYKKNGASSVNWLETDCYLNALQGY